MLGASGGVGQAAIELGKAMGARVIACASSEDKLALCRSLGADAVVNYSTASLRDSLKELTEGRGVDVVYDPVGGTLSEAALRATAWEGRFLVIGFASGTIPKIPLNLVLLKGIAIRPEASHVLGSWQQTDHVEINPADEDAILDDRRRSISMTFEVGQE